MRKCIFFIFFIFLCFSVFGLSLNINDPSANDYISGAYKLKISVSPDYSNISLVNFYYKKGDASNVLIGSSNENKTEYAVDWSSTNIVDGSDYKIIVAVTECGGGNCQTQQNEVAGLIVDNTKPVAIIVAPEKNVTSTSVDFKYVARDNVSGLDTCAYNLNDGLNVTLSGCGNISLTIINQGKNNLVLHVKDKAGNLNSTSVEFTLDSEAPIVKLIEPENKGEVVKGDVVFKYNVTDNNTVSNCSLYINKNLEKSESSIIKDKTQSFLMEEMEETLFMKWKVACIDIYGNKGESDIWELEVKEEISESKEEVEEGKSATVVTRSWNSVTPEEPASFIIKNSDIPVSKVLLEPVEEVKDLKLIVKQIIDEPSEASKLSGEVYKFFSIGAEGITTTKISKATIDFEIKKKWLDEKSISKEDIVLKKYAGSDWEELSTEFLKQKDEKYYFSSITSGFSIFAISVKEKVVVEEKKEGEGKLKDESKSWLWLWILIISLLVGIGLFFFFATRDKFSYRGF